MPSDQEARSAAQTQRADVIRRLRVSMGQEETTLDEVLDSLLAVAQTLTSVPLTWEWRGEAEKASFDATLRAYQLALRVLDG